MLDAKTPPHLILDTTMMGSASAVVKSFTAALALPTISASFERSSNSQKWQNLDINQQEFLIQIMPPADIIPEIIRTIILHQNISNAVILFDYSFGKNHKTLCSTVIP